MPCALGFSPGCNSCTPCWQKKLKEKAQKKLEEEAQKRALDNYRNGVADERKKEHDLNVLKKIGALMLERDPRTGKRMYTKEQAHVVVRTEARVDIFGLHGECPTVPTSMMCPWCEDYDSREHNIVMCDGKPEALCMNCDAMYEIDRCRICEKCCEDAAALREAPIRSFNLKCKLVDVESPVDFQQRKMILWRIVHARNPDGTSSEIDIDYFDSLSHDYYRNCTIGELTKTYKKIAEYHGIK